MMESIRNIIVKVIMMPAVLVSLSLFSCTETDSADQGAKEPVSGLFDYSKMGEHPRLLIRTEDFARMKDAIGSDRRLASVHEAIIARSEYHLTQGEM